MEKPVEIEEAGYESEDEELTRKKKKRTDILYQKTSHVPHESTLLKGRKKQFAHASSQSELIRQKATFLNLNAYDRHREMVNNYLLYYKGSTAAVQRDTSRDKRDSDVIREHHQFLWRSDDEADSWEKKLAKKYYDKLFKEYCVCDLRFYKENKVAMRWRTEKELVDGKGQFSCGEKHCEEKEHLRTWEVNFGYVEQGVKKNALIKLRLCPDCSYKLNYRNKRKEVTKNPKRLKHKRRLHGDNTNLKGESKKAEEEPVNEEKEGKIDENSDIWSRPEVDLGEKTREDDFETYIEDLFL